MSEISSLEDKLAGRCAAAMYERDEASRSLGIEIAEVKAGSAVLTMPVANWMLNGAKVCHGGLIFTLADTAMAFASNSRNDNMLAINASVEFLAAGKAGETLTAIAKEVHRAGRTATYEVAVQDPNGALVAQFLGRTYRVKGQQIDAE
ncbi:MAG: hydroxyphenylacetyl-CoA thioesterase PaaI [Pseudomonadota bacterium]